MARLIRTRVDSSSLDSITYDPKEELLEVKFRRTGHVYAYFGVSRDLYRAFMEAESKGAFLNEVIKPNHDYARIEIGAW